MKFLRRIPTHILFLITVVVMCGLVLGLQYQNNIADYFTPKFSVNEGTPELSATAYYVFDIATGKTLAAKNEHRTLPIASVTKLPAAAAWREVVTQEATTTISWQDTLAEGRAGKLMPNTTYQNRELLFPLLLESSNDAAAAMRRVSEGSVLERMNEFAEELHLFGTQFADASGLSEGNVATAVELATLVRFLERTDPHVFDITALPEYLTDQNGWINNNPLAELPGYRGGKHGFTNAANRTAVVLYSEPFTDSERTIGYIVLGSDDLVDDVTTLRQFVHDFVVYE